MGRVEKTLLLFLAACVAVVGWLSMQSAGAMRARALAAPPDSAGQETTSPAAIATATPRPVAISASSPHVSGAMVRSALPAPVRDVPSLRREIASRAPGTYVEYMLANNDSLIVRWPERYSTALKVWIQPSSEIAGWTTTMASAARDAFGVWSSISLPVRFEFVKDSSSAEIVVGWVDHFTGPQVGSTRRYRDQHGWLGRAEISLALRTNQGAAIDERYLTAVVIHEVGHAMGLDHSPSTADIMADRNDGVFLPTPEDRATMSLLYSVAPGSIK